MNGKNTMVASVIVTALVFGGGGYMLGKKSAGNTASPQGFQRGAFGDRAGGQTGANRTLGARGGGTTVGEVLSKDGTMMTVKLRDGGSKIVFYSASTAVMHTATGTIGDVEVGGQVFVNGTQNADGSVTAESIQLRPEGTMMRTGTLPQ